MKSVFISLLFVLCLGLYADISGDSQVFEDHEEWVEGLAFLESSKNQVTGRAKADLLANMSQFQLEVGDLRELDGAPKNELLSLYEQGEAYARQALELDSRNVEAYFWAAANIGRWGQTKGILDSLFKAGPMRENLLKGIRIDDSHADCWYLMGMLYFEVPPIISFGNKTWAVSFMRKAIDHWIEPGQPLTYQFELARFLHDRNWSKSKRSRELQKMNRRFSEKRDILEKNSYYEGTMNFDSSLFYTNGQNLSALSDREEAELLLNNIVSFLTGKNQLLPSERERLAETRELLADW